MRASTSKHHMTDDGWMTMLFQISNLKMHDDRISNQQDDDDDDDDVAIVRSRAVDGRMDDRSIGRSFVRSFGGGGISESRVVALCRRSSCRQSLMMLD